MIESLVVNENDNDNLVDRHRQIYCDLNRMCLCQNYTKQYMDVTCINVPFDSLPDLSRMMNESIQFIGQHLYRVRIHGARQLTRINDRNSFAHLITLASLSITNTKLSYIDGNVFHDLAISRTLTTLDLSYGQLVDIPIDALDHLEQLQWLSLKGNQIEVIKHIPINRLQRLRSLLLNENRLFIIEDGSFSQLTALEQIDFDSNMIERVEGNPFPLSLRSLSLSNCLLRKIPFDAIEPLAKLEILQLQGNLISHLSPFKLSVRRIQLIDLSHNLIGQIPENLFANFQSSNRIADRNLKRNENGIRMFTAGHLMKNSSWNNVDDSTQTRSNESDVEEELRIEQLYLDFNFIQSLGSDLFRPIRLDKLSLSNNRLSSAGLSQPATFDGPTAQSLKVLNVNYNLIDKYPIAFRSLTGLRQLLMKNNRIQTIDPHDVFGASAKTLEVLDLSQNLIERMPTAALNTLRNLIRINLHDNAISRLDSDDLVGWCGPKLKSLTLSKNNLAYLSTDAFRACRQLNELRLGGNRLLQIQPVQLARYLNRLQLLDLSSLAAVDWHGIVLNTNVSSETAKFPQIKWLQFDFNQLRSIPSQMITMFPGIKHLDLQNNHIDSIAANRLSEAKHLQSVIISYNHLSRIYRNSFARLVKLESLTLYFNRIERLDSGAFNELPRLQSLVLSRNQINYMEPGTFINIANESNSLTLLLDGNRLECLSIDPFLYIHQQPAAFTANDGDDQFALYLNVSNNQIKTLANCQNSATATTTNNNNNSNNNLANIVRRNQREQTLAVRVLDLSANQIEQLRPHFLHQFCGKTLSMLANHNLIRRLPLKMFGVEYCAQLQSLSLNHNYIVDLQFEQNELNQTSMSTTIDDINSSFAIQTLSLQHNLIKDLARFHRLFVRCTRLKSS
ncbi:chaoptin-like protein [Euroglyphus maynei]|uniref:Chaoptin-like protein n=1 Tax=Euroglyphus maynei TaxID=6958 RepID=A0A1Y3ASX2_EURMA|nr:chaoptin-like protein [Euroglyphus maynei]